MKKVLFMALSMVLCLGLMFMTGCGGGNIDMILLYPMGNGLSRFSGEL